MKNQSFIRRLGFAWAGVNTAWQREASFRLQCLATLGVLLVLLWRRPAPLWWALLLICCAMVLAAELMNSALEYTLDHLHPERHPSIRIAKDCAAGAVLVLCLASAAVFVAFLLTW